MKSIFEEECNSIKKLLNLIQKPPQRTLDLGTGIGDSLHLLNAFTNRILLDFSYDMISRVNFRESDTCLVANVNILPFKKKNFDLITCIGVSEYILEKEILLRQIYQFLSPEGYSLITFSPPKAINKMRSLLGNRIYPIKGSTTHDLIAAQGFFLVRYVKTKMQSQYLLQKL